MAKKIQGPAKVCCSDCRHAVPVTHEHLAHDGTPIFCTCEFIRYYRQMRWPQPCATYEPKNENR